RAPVFQTGYAGSIPVARSDVLSRDTVYTVSRLRTFFVGSRGLSSMSRLIGSMITTAGTGSTLLAMPPGAGEGEHIGQSLFT
ncbi:MAG: hypothetical protein L0G89_06590, partial [Janibacter sp.]|nr:hypothetical protein [Janibacter sp.]